MGVRKTLTRYKATSYLENQLMIKEKKLKLIKKEKDEGKVSQNVIKSYTIYNEYLEHELTVKKMTITRLEKEKEEEDSRRKIIWDQLNDNLVKIDQYIKTLHREYDECLQSKILTMQKQQEASENIHQRMQEGMEEALAVEQKLNKDLAEGVQKIIHQKRPLARNLRLKAKQDMKQELAALLEEFNNKGPGGTVKTFDLAQSCREEIFNNWSRDVSRDPSC